MVGDEGEPGEDGVRVADGDGSGDAGADRATDPEVVLELPESAREAFKDPFGPVFSDAAALLSSVDGPLIAVGDVVTYHLEEAGESPDVAFVDGRTERERAPPEVRSAVAERSNRLGVTNPAGTITAALLEATVEAIAAPEPTTVVVEGEEDLAAVPAVLAAPDGATVVYGQPGEGMVTVEVTSDVRERFGELLDAFEGDVERARAVLVDG